MSQGQNIRWVLLRGLGREIAHWKDFPTELARCEEHAEFIDLPGTGTEWARVAPLTISATVDDLRSRLKTKTPIGLLAISLGGMVALDWAARYPDEISRMVIINSSVSGLVAPWKRMRPKAMLNALDFVLARNEEAKEMAALKVTTCLTGDDLKKQAHEFADVRRRHPVKVSAVIRQFVGAFRFRLGEKPKCPVLVVQSLGDKLVDPSCSEAIAKKIGAKLVTHPTAGHDLPLDDPKWLAKTIHDWVK